MALRVLLADENVTIKKVIQLALSDYAVTVKSVNLGIDVVEIAKSFKPDVVFADILLQKRNGYEVCSDFKGDAELKSVPVVLLWSGFMELDRDRFVQCQADGEIEKPFDKDDLRALIQKLVPKTSSNPMAAHLKIPEPPPMEVRDTEGQLIQKKQPIPATAPAAKPAGAPNLPDFLVPPPAKAPAPAQSPQSSDNTDTSSWNMDSFEEIEDFVEQPLGNVEQEEGEDLVAIHLRPAPTAPTSPVTDEDDEDEEEEWVQQPIAPPPVQAAPTSIPLPQTSPVSDEAEDDFVMAPTAPAEEPQSPPTPQYSDDSSFSAFKLNVSVDDDDSDLLSEHFNLDALNEEIPAARFLHTDEKIDSTVEESDEENILEQSSTHVDLSQKLTPDQIEEILRAQSKEVIESIVWKIVPDMAEKIIREELEKIIKETEL